MARDANHECFLSHFIKYTGITANLSIVEAAVTAAVVVAMEVVVAA